MAWEINMSGYWKVRVFAVLTIWSAKNLGTMLYSFSSYPMKTPPAL